MPNVLIIAKKWLFLLSGILWTIAGSILCSRAIMWTEQVGSTYKIIVEIIGLLLAATGYFQGFSKIVKKNIKRIYSLPKQTSMFSFVSLKGYIMIGMMISMGILLRSLPFPKYFLSIPYMAMGGVLLIGSIRYYSEYILFIDKSQR